MKIHIRRSFGCSSASYDASCDIQRTVAEKLSAMLPERAESALEIGTGTGVFTQYLRGRCGHVVCLDIADSLLMKAREIYQEMSYVCGDGENLPLKGGFDLITGSSALQWFQNPSVSLPKMLNKLKKGGQFCFSVFVEGTFVEMGILNGMTGFGSVYNLPKEDDFVKYFGGCITESYVREYVLWFDSPAEFLKKQKGTGATFTGVNKFTSKTSYKKFMELYPELFGENGMIPVTYRILYIKGIIP